MKTWVLLGALLLCAGCSSKSGSERVTGSDYLAQAQVDIEEVAFDILRYPITEPELAFFLKSTSEVVEAGEAYPTFWTDVSDADAPVRELLRHEIWEEAGVDSLAYVAAFVKLNFLEEHLQDPVTARSIRERISRMKSRVEEEGESGDPDFRYSLLQLEKLASALEAQEQSEAFKLYRSNQAQVETALDRFRSMGEPLRDSR